MKPVIPMKCFHDLHVLLVDLVTINVAFFERYTNIIIQMATLWKNIVKYQFNIL